MMRVLVALLLLANLAFLGWARWIAPEPLPTVDPLTASVPRLRLAGEVSPGQTPTVPAPAASSAVSAAAGSSRALSQCATLGPFDADAAAQQAATVLRAKGFETLDRTAQSEIPDGFWVYIGGVESLASARAIVGQLQANGIADAAEMPPSPAGLRVAIGVFTEREGAERRAAAVSQLGFTPRVAEHTHPATRYFLDVRVRGGSQGLKPGDLETLNRSGANVSLVPCPAR
jgi:hypothetical protein